MIRILLADDDVDLCEMLAEYLTAEGFSITFVHDGETALRRAREDVFDLVVLDVMMPRKGGFDVLRELRTDSLTPVLMLTARGEDVDSIVGLELGADDYLAKPCNPRVLTARIRAVLRRVKQRPDEDINETPQVLVQADLTLHMGARRVTCIERDIALTSTEFSVLQVLLLEAGHIVSKQTLSEQALGRRMTRFDRSLDMHVSNLRHKLGALADGDERIKTIRGVGYQYVIK
ncbi:copper-sensing two-component system response regulator CpxR [Sulfuriferula multivorans]|uniref:Copper-sensing two-component system response regulator CpxR n=1 Tax=Sulfuriferula multivorans TaxID=1559896 RepID=A0A401JAI7_9PROT|nr:response regulator transcription factor [Sulfuriferula multivorans]GBL44685.1 copper-sensing two-component system response regulator CpxR [Sulfuriferula multivorans]